MSKKTKIFFIILIFTIIGIIAWAEMRQAENNAMQKNLSEYIIEGDKQCIVKYVPKERIYPAFGYAIGNEALVRQDLSYKTKRFVRSHELYHCFDQATWGGWVGREMRANIMAGFKDPIGFLSTAWETISDIDRVKFYIQRVKEGF